MRPRFMNRGSRAAEQREQSAPARFNEAPIHESGKFGGVFLPHGDAVASMRPRFMNRGSRLGLNDSVRSDSASMRPRFMNRGSGGESDADRVRQLGFNEAPIHESGKDRFESELAHLSAALQ